jgi:hypothetical protein
MSRDHTMNTNRKESTMDTITDPKMSIVHYDRTDGVKRTIIQDSLMLVTMPCVSAVITNEWSGDVEDPASKVVGHTVRLHILLDPENYDLLPFAEVQQPDGLDDGRMKNLSLSPAHNGINGTRSVEIAFSRTMTDEEYDAMIQRHRVDGNELALMIDEMARETAEELAKKEEN